MLTVKEALEMELSTELKEALKLLPGDYMLALTQANELVSVPPTGHNAALFKIQDDLIKELSRMSERPEIN